MTAEPVSNPLVDLQTKLRRDQDRRDRLLIRTRELTRELGDARTELAELDVSIRATRGLLNLADAAQKQAAKTTDTTTTTTPAAPATPRKRAAKP